MSKRTEFVEVNAAHVLDYRISSGARFIELLLKSREDFDPDWLASNAKVHPETLTKWLNELERHGRFVWPNKRNIVYVIKNLRNGYFKIGHTFGYSVSTRFRTLQAEDPDLRLILTLDGDKKLEKALHTEFQDKRLKGEWFSLSDADLHQLLHGVTGRPLRGSSGGGSSPNSSR